MRNEPVLAAVTAFVTAGLALLVAFGVALTSVQIAAIGGFVVAAYGLGALVRQHVTPTRKLGDEDGQSLIEVAAFLLIVVVALAIALRFL